jgi:hypothetical protein
MYMPSLLQAIPLMEEAPDFADQEQKDSIHDQIYICTNKS